MWCPARHVYGYSYNTTRTACMTIKDTRPRRTMPTNRLYIFFIESINHYNAAIPVTEKADQSAVRVIVASCKYVNHVYILRTGSSLIAATFYANFCI
jgi:hypothetical protein